MELQYNAFSNKEYEGGRNQAELMTYRELMGFKSSGWVTFLQARQMGLKVKKGSKGISIFKGFKQFDEKDEEGKLKTVSYPVGFARVFNLDQTEKREDEQERQDEIQEESTSMEEKLEALQEVR